MRSPTTNDPRALTANVPHGKRGPVTFWTQPDTRYRRVAPMAPPTAMASKRITRPWLTNLQELDVEDQCRIRRDDVTRSFGAVAQRGRDHELPPAAHLHPRHTLVPARDHAAGPEPEFERLVAIAAGVEFRPIGKP